MQYPHAQPLLIVQTGQPLPALRRRGSFAHWIRVAAGLPGDDAVVVDVAGGAPLPSTEGFAGVIVTGSGAMVSHRLDWSERSAAWLRDAAHADVPLFGICYGHQLLAHALGGRVDDHPAGREMGTVALTLQPAARDDAVFGGLPLQFDAHATHVQSVLQVPDGATVLASSAHDPVHAYRWGNHAWGVQFHPEFSATHMRGYVHARRQALVDEGLDAAAMARSVSAAPHARRVLRNFVRHARRSRRGPALGYD